MNELLKDRPVVVGVDGTEFSLRALEWAAAYAVKHDCPLRIVHVQAGREPGSATVRALVDHRLSLHDGPRPVTIWRDRSGPRAHILSDEARGARLLVLGHREPQPLLGSTLRGVLTDGTDAVLAVPGRWSADVKPNGRMVVGVKSAGSRRVLDVAFKMAAEQGSRLQVISTIPMPAPPAGRSLLDEIPRQEAKARAALEAALAEPRRKYPQVVAEPLVVQGDPATLLTRAARNADLLIIGGRAQHTLPTMIGSTTESIMKQIDRPAVVVRPTTALRRRKPAAA
jgi:nucleotide-binding universal stress UspA family protein